MFIVDEERTLSHFGVTGMKWGVRRDAFLERERALRNKAENIVKTQSKSEKANAFDVGSAAYMSKTAAQKIFSTVAMQIIGTIAAQAITGKLTTVVSDRAQLKRTITKIAMSSALKLGTTELKGRGSLKRYTQKGEKDLSKKQYKWMTPEHALAATIKTAVMMTPFLAAIGKQKLRSVVKNKYETQKRVDKWGDHLLGTKTSDMHTIFSDPEGYMSVLAKIPKG